MTRNDVADQIVHTTVRIETVSAEGKCASGTGFFVQFCAQEGQSVPAIVTNRHVVEGAERGAIHMTRSDGGGQPIFGEHVRLPISHFGNGSIPHPDPDIDLVALPMALLLHHFAQQGERVFYKSWKLSDIADEAYLAGLTAIEDILMVGYPNGGIRRITCPSFGGA